MNARYVLATLPAAIAAIAIAWAHTRGGYHDGVGSVAFIPSETATPPATVTPTPLYGWQSAFNGGIAEDAQDALGFAREVYQACPPYCTADADLRSVQYVQTTVAKLRQVFGPPKSTLFGDPGATINTIDAPEDWPVWAILAQGSFHGWGMGLATHEYYVGSNFWVFVPKDRQYAGSFATDHDYDIGQLGVAHEVPLPLPKWPTPVPISTPPPRGSSP